MRCVSRTAAQSEPARASTTLSPSCSQQLVRPFIHPSSPFPASSTHHRLIMSSHVPWKELAVVGATTLGVCCAIGWLTGAENLQKKKKAQQRGPNGNSVESQECDALIGIADAAMKKGAYSDVEIAYPLLSLFCDYSMLFI